MTREAELLASLDRGFAAARRRAGAHLVCRAGCGECCRRPFPINRLDARRLRRFRDALAQTDPARRSRLVARSRVAAARLRAVLPDGVVPHDPTRLDAAFERLGELPCPALDPEHETCDVYEARPVACRIYGPPTRFGATDAPPCRLCFTTASPREVERARFEPDPAGEERRLLDGLGAPPDEEWSTFVAFELEERG